MDSRHAWFAMLVRILTANLISEWRLNWLPKLPCFLQALWYFVRSVDQRWGQEQWSVISYQLHRSSHPWQNLSWRTTEENGPCSSSFWAVLKYPIKYIYVLLKVMTSKGCQGLNVQFLCLFSNYFREVLLPCIKNYKSGHNIQLKVLYLQCWCGQAVHLIVPGMG